MYYKNKFFSSLELKIEVKFMTKWLCLSVCLQTFNIFYFIFPHLYMKFDDKLLEDYSDNADAIYENW